MKPKLYRCTRRNVWLCILDHVQGEGTTKRHAFLSWCTRHALHFQPTA